MKQRDKREQLGAPDDRQRDPEGPLVNARRSADPAPELGNPPPVWHRDGEPQIAYTFGQRRRISHEAGVACHLLLALRDTGGDLPVQ